MPSKKGEGIRGYGNSWQYLPPIVGKTMTAEACDLARNVMKLVAPSEPVAADAGR
ncbi:MAG TPA: hypothetical protein VJM08_10965 [Anaerolineales bacterium]|nr:hypothetical protein [Anaerolineales bacterium]